LCGERCQRDPAAALRTDAHVRIFLQAHIQSMQRLPHLVLQLTNEALCIEQQLQGLIVFLALLLEIGRQILLGVR
jgi:hypothetical protein